MPAAKYSTPQHILLYSIGNTVTHQGGNPGYLFEGRIGSGANDGLVAAKTQLFLRDEHCGNPTTGR